MSESDIPPPADSESDMESFFRRHRNHLGPKAVSVPPTTVPTGPPTTPARDLLFRHSHVSPFSRSASLQAEDPQNPHDSDSAQDSGGAATAPALSGAGGTVADNFIDPVLRSTSSPPLTSSREVGRSNSDTYAWQARPGNLLQFAEREAAVHKLQGDTKAAFVKWTKASTAEREAAIGAMLFSIEAQLKTISLRGTSGSTEVVAAPWTVPERIVKNINKYAICLLLSPNLAEYDGEGLVETLSSIVERKGWGLPDNLRKQDEEKWDCIVSCIRNHLTQRKSEIKKTLLQSVGMEDPSSRTVPASEATASGSASQHAPPGHHAKPTWHIYQLCKHLTTAMGKKSGINTNLTVTLEMCARIAFLRSQLVAWVKYPYIKDRKTGVVKNYSAHFYKFVDKGLEAFRAEGQGDPQKIHAYVTVYMLFMAYLTFRSLFVSTLREDQTFYPPKPNSSHKDVFAALRGANPSDAQEYVEQFVMAEDIAGQVAADE
ncbi:hypothetical protein BV20DRAFT_982546 [Pilatotrama ljubarskyi]|nr:hypothetical protein BV20DRAFT_982546 [Pilatotrama ljubarskyi]